MPIQPTISIIIPTFNCSKVLEACLKSVVSQTYINKEVVVIDGNSTDTTLQIIQKYKKHINYWVSEPDRGIYDAMNKGIAASSGEWLYFMGSDDVFFDAKVLEEVFADEKSIDNDVIYGNVVLKQSGDIYDGLFDNDKLYNKNICHQAIIMKKTVFEKIGLFDTKYKIWADYELNIRWFNRPDIKHSYIEKTICLYNDDGFSTLYADKDFLLAKDQLFSQHNYIITVSAIITTCHNVNLSESLDKLLNQTYQYLDIILVGDFPSIDKDHKSTIEGYISKNKKIQFVELQQKSTLLEHWTEGVKAAKGQYIWIMGLDYAADRDTIHTLTSFFKAGTMAELIYCLPTNLSVDHIAQRSADTSKRNQQEIFVENDKEGDSVISIFKRGKDLNNKSAIFFKKSTYPKTGCSNLILRQGQEWLIWSYLLLISDVVYAKKITFELYQKTEKEPVVLLDQATFVQQLGLLVNRSTNLSAKFRNRAFVTLTHWWVSSLIKGDISWRRSKDIYIILNRMGSYLNKLILKFAIK